MDGAEHIPYKIMYVHSASWMKRVLIQKSPCTLNKEGAKTQKTIHFQRRPYTLPQTGGANFCSVNHGKSDTWGTLPEKPANQKPRSLNTADLTKWLVSVKRFRCKKRYKTKWLSAEVIIQTFIFACHFHLEATELHNHGRVWQHNVKSLSSPCWWETGFLFTQPHFLK